MSHNQKQKGSIFDQFTNKYSLQKTLRFELKPVGKTRDILTANQVLLKDEKIESAYQVLKPVFDKIHEWFITEGLESPKFKGSISFTDYFNLYKKQKVAEKDKKKDFDKDIEKSEKDLRMTIGKAFDFVAVNWKNRVGKNKKGKEILKESGYKILTEVGILNYIKNNVEDLAKAILDESENLSDKKKQILEAVGSFEKFFTYFSGFNQNRENYYSTEEKATAVANRIVSENLPKFCDNLFDFSKDKNEYLKIFSELDKTNKIEGKIGKDKNGKPKEIEKFHNEIFTVSYFVNCLSQNEIDDYNEKIGDNNFLINLYNQHTSKKLQVFKSLYKQIGCGNRKNLFVSINSNNEVKEKLEEVRKAGKKYFSKTKNKIGEIQTIFDFVGYILGLENLKGVYWSDKAINTISAKYLQNWYFLKTEVWGEKDRKGDLKGREIKIPVAVELSDLFEVLDKTEIAWKDSLLEDTNKEKIIESKNLKNSQKLLRMIFADIKNNTDKFLSLADDIFDIPENDYQKDEVKQKIKSWLDLALWTNQILKYFKVKDNKIRGSSLDPKVDEMIKNIIFAEDNPIKNYDVIRNFLTKKVTDGANDNKLKLNFDNSTLADGWDLNKVSDNWCVILKDKNDKKYLAVIVAGNNKIFDKDKNFPLYQTSVGEIWQKMEYKLLPSPSKMLPKVFLKKSGEKSKVRDEYKENNFMEVERVYNSGTFKKDDFVKSDLEIMIDFYKKSIRKYKDWGVFDFIFEDTKKYAGISEFYSDVERQGYKISYTSISSDELTKLVNLGKIYLFEIKNKDNNLEDGRKKDGKKNLYTIYWNAIFSTAENKPKLNGGAELFYRPAVENLENAKNGEGKEVKLKNGQNAIKGFRFSKEKFLFHCPITLNFYARNSYLNREINQKISSDKNVRILGIDRGEKHLAYYSLIDQKGEIVKRDEVKMQGTLNLPFLDKDGKPRAIKVEKKKIVKDRNDEEKIEMEIVECWDYNQMLEAKAGDRDFSRKNWQAINTIKELKDGYVSLVVRKIVDLAVENDAVIVLEDLNKGFKRSRIKMENQVYQKLELALAKKLNFLVDKRAGDGDIGSVGKALQLTPLVDNFSDIEGRTQFGVMFYTRANYTSQTDPMTGWRRKIRFNKTKQEDLKAEICDKFLEIGSKNGDYYFEYKDETTGKVWRLWSGENRQSLDRYRGGRDSNGLWKIEKIDVTKLLDDVFEGFDLGSSLREQILNGDGLDNSLVPKLKYAIEVIMQIRNVANDKTIKEKGETWSDFIQSPVRDGSGNHFDSRKRCDVIPNGDANGAYNIARKGLMMLGRVKEFEAKTEAEKKKLKNPDLFIRDEDWDKFAQSHSVDK